MVHLTITIQQPDYIRDCAIDNHCTDSKLNDYQTWWGTDRWSTKWVNYRTRHRQQVHLMIHSSWPSLQTHTLVMMWPCVSSSDSWQRPAVGKALFALTTLWPCNTHFAATDLDCQQVFNLTWTDGICFSLPQLQIDINISYGIFVILMPGTYNISIPLYQNVFLPVARLLCTHILHHSVVSINMNGFTCKLDYVCFSSMLGVV